MKLIKWVPTSVALGGLILAYANGIVSNVMANGCYRATRVNLGNSTTYGCPATLSLINWGINTIGELSNVWYPTVTTTGAPSMGYENYEAPTSEHMNCDYVYWDAGSGTYKVKVLENQATASADFDFPDLGSMACYF